MSRVVLRIRGAADGDGSVLVSKVFRMYSMYVKAQGWSMDEITDAALLNEPRMELVAALSGENVFNHLQYESGIHRMQWIPWRKSGRIVTSKVEVAVVPEAEQSERSSAGDYLGETIRTYSFPLNQVTEHRIPFTLRTLDFVMNGDLDPIILALKEHYEK